MSRERAAAALVETARTGGHRLTLLTGSGSLRDALTEPGDLDVAMDVDAVRFFREHGRLLRGEGLHPFLFHQYDIGPAHAVWIWDDTDGSILHFDVLCDPDGVGRLGVPTLPLLAASNATMSPEWRLAYRVSKRLWKRQWARLAALPPIGVTSVSGSPLADVFGVKGAALVLSLFEQGADASAWHAAAPGLTRARWRRRATRANGPQWLALARSARALHRLRYPVGRRVHVSGLGARVLAEEVGQQIGGALPHHAVQEHDARPRSSLRRAAIARLPSLQLTWLESDGQKAHGVDLVLAAADDPSSADVASALADRLCFELLRGAS